MKPRNIISWLFISYICAGLFNSQSLSAQEGARPPAIEARPAVQLTPNQLKAVTGVFQSPRNPEMYIQFTTTNENAILGKLLWNNNQIRFTPESELDFFNKDANEGSPLRLSFKKDSTGAVALFTMGNNDQWKLIKDYKPVVKVEMNHTPAQLKAYEGVYQIQNGQPRFVQFYEKDNKMIMKQHWDGSEIAFVPETEFSFFSKELALFSIVFSKDPDGNFTKAVVNKRDNWTKLAPIHPTTEQLKIYEGKYQSTDDEDNLLQLIARDNKLVVKQLWDKKEIVLTPKTDVYYYSDEQSYSLLFQKDKEGALTQVRVLGIDLFKKVKE